VIEVRLAGHMAQAQVLRSNLGLRICLRLGGPLSRAVREGGIRSTLMALLFFLLLADSSWVILFREFERLVMILSVPQKGKSKNGVAPALESHRPTPTTATPAFVGGPGRERRGRVDEPFPFRFLCPTSTSRVPRSRAVFATGVPDERWCCGRWGGDGGVR